MQDASKVSESAGARRVLLQALVKRNRWKCKRKCKGWQMYNTLSDTKQNSSL